ncbi:unnamed protein product [Thlaspi arvense]|uniref:Uncharacterized protein n=1 Tax=Thlaspi arvense TaxID=13288 RepID=A0AAU9SUG4_THLAR|nr:unnamed protein product [Thlaspi arvense]
MEHVIGQVVDVKDLQGVQVNGKERKKIEFELRDTNSSGGNSNVSTAPSSKRSFEEFEELPDLSSTSMKLCTKSIKLEKINDYESTTKDERLMVELYKEIANKAKAEPKTHDIKLEKMIQSKKSLMIIGSKNAAKDIDVEASFKEEDKAGP